MSSHGIRKQAPIQTGCGPQPNQAAPPRKLAIAKKIIG